MLKNGVHASKNALRPGAQGPTLSWDQKGGVTD